jgi:hypothetical protein
MFVIPDGDSLVQYLLDFTGSTDEDEIKQCIFLAELSMRNLEIPALRTNPYNTFGTVGENQLMPIPKDMLKPILFFQQGNNGVPTTTGPWIVFDRIGDRDIITGSLIANLYLTPVNVPQVIRGKFSEVGEYYQFLPYVGAGTVLNLYYYRAWNLLFTPTTTTTTLSSTATITSVTGTGTGPWTATITNLNSVFGATVGDVITAFPSTGSLSVGGVATVASLVNSNTITATVTGGSIPVAGTIENVIVSSATTVQSNPVLQTWPEGYVYGTLSEYYLKRHNSTDAELWKAKFDMAWATVENQNNLGKWSGGNTKMTSVFQPRRDRQYAVK